MKAEGAYLFRLWLADGDRDLDLDRDREAERPLLGADPDRDRDLDRERLKEKNQKKNVGIVIRSRFCRSSRTEMFCAVAHQ